jgi:hypothetical protein
MNERIRELHSQCKVCDKDTVLYFDYEKFAELIVRECAKVADGGWADPGHQIKQHFGVEE